MAHSITSTIWASKEEYQQLMAIWPDIVRDITEATESLNIPDVAKWLEKVSHY